MQLNFITLGVTNCGFVVLKMNSVNWDLRIALSIWEVIFWREWSAVGLSWFQAKGGNHEALLWNQLWSLNLVICCVNDINQRTGCFFLKIPTCPLGPPAMQDLQVMSFCGRLTYSDETPPAMKNLENQPKLVTKPFLDDKLCWLQVTHLDRHQWPAFSSPVLQFPSHCC